MDKWTFGDREVRGELLHCKSEERHPDFAVWQLLHLQPDI